MGGTRGCMCFGACLSLCGVCNSTPTWLPCLFSSVTPWPPLPHPHPPPLSPPPLRFALPRNSGVDPSPQWENKASGPSEALSLVYMDALLLDRGAVGGQAARSRCWQEG